MSDEWEAGGWMEDTGPIGWYTRPPVEGEAEPLAFPETGWLKPVAMKFTFTDVDPEALGILTGGVLGTKPEPVFSMNITRPAYPVRRRAWRVVWEWLTRTPRKYHPASHMYFPAVRMAEGENDA